MFLIKYFILENNFLALFNLKNYNYNLVAPCIINQQNSH